MESPIRPPLISVYLLKYAITLTVCTSTGARRPNNYIRKQKAERKKMLSESHIVQFSGLTWCVFAENIRNNTKKSEGTTKSL